MSYKTNRDNGGIFRVRDENMETIGPKRESTGAIIEDAPEIIGFEYSGTPYVEDGSGARYTVKYADGRELEVEFSDRLDTEASMPETIEEAEEMEDTAQEFYLVTVVWDGAVDFEQGYDANSESQRTAIQIDLTKRYGKIAEDWLGTTRLELEQKGSEIVEDNDTESLL